MPSNRMPLYIIGGVAVLLIAAVITYAMSQNSAAPAKNTNQDTSSEAGQNDENQEPTEADKVTVENFSYGPKTITVKVGTTVIWTNNDNVEHTVTTDDGAPEKIDSGLFGEGETFSFTFEEAGTYDYFCEPHPYMKGMVVVTE